MVDGPSFASVRAALNSLHRRYIKGTKRRECPPVFLVLEFAAEEDESRAGRVASHRLALPHHVRPFPWQSALIFVRGDSQAWQHACAGVELNVKFVSVSQLKSSFSSQRAQDMLFKSADVFFCEHAAAQVLPRLLKGRFFSRKRQPILVRLEQTPDQIRSELEAATVSAELFLKRNARSFIRVGSFDLSFDNLAENVLAAFQLALEKCSALRRAGLMCSGIDIPDVWVSGTSPPQTG